LSLETDQKARIYNKGSKIRLIFWAILAFSITLRVRAFLEGRSLWLDESMLAVNILDRSLGGLLTLPLENNQSAPPGFLVTTFFFIKAFGLTEFSIRLVPMLVSIGAVFLFYSTSRRALRSWLGIASANLLFAVSPVLIYYSHEFKQYSVDVFAVLFFAWLLAGGFRYERRASRIVELSLIGWLISSSLIAIPLFALYLLVKLSRDGKISDGSFRLFFAKNKLEIGTALFFAVFHGLHLVLNSKVDTMTRYWIGVGGLPPTRIESESHFWWLPLRVANLMSDPFIDQQVGAPRSLADSPGIWIPVLFLIVLALVFYLKDPIVVFSIASLTMTPVLAFAYIYPMGGRLSLFALPLIILLIGFGIQAFCDKFHTWGPLWALILILALTLTPLRTSLGYFLSPNDSRDTIWSLEQIKANRSISDTLLADSPNRNQIRFHQFVGYESGVDVQNISVALSSLGSEWEPPSDSLWVLSTHRINEAREILQNLESRGFVEQCRFDADSTLLVFMVNESRSEPRECSFTSKD
jgi:hypothetical protein